MTDTTEYDTGSSLGWDPLEGPEEGLPTVYPDLPTWMSHWFAPVVRRRPRAWCPQWWKHAEANARLGALWAAWEAAQREAGGGPSYWWIAHFDAHWRVLTDERDGPFAGCGNEHKRDPEPLELVDAPLASKEEQR